MARLRILVYALVAALWLSSVLATPARASDPYDCYSAPSSPGDRRPDKNRLVVASYNAEWLMYNSSQCPGMCPWKTLADCQKHINAIASVLVELDADVINLLEVQDCVVLQMVIDAMGSSGSTYRAYMRQGTDTYTGENAALLTRVDPIVDLQRTDARVDTPVSGSQCTSPLKRGDVAERSDSTTVSKHYYTQINVSGQTIMLIGVHFKAIPTEDTSCEQREGQAVIIANLIAEMAVPDKANLILMGDFNDYDQNLLVLTQYQPTSRTFAFVRHPSPSSTYTLYNVGSIAGDPTVRYSNWWDKDGSCDATPDELTVIDHQLVSSGLLVDSLKSASFVQAYEFYCDNYYYSDHYPIVSVFDTTDW